MTLRNAVNEAVFAENCPDCGRQFCLDVSEHYVIAFCLNCGYKVEIGLRTDFYNVGSAVGLIRAFRNKLAQRNRQIRDLRRQLRK